MLCRLIRKLAQELADNENEKINAIKTLLIRNTKDSTISEELKILLSEQGMNQINQDIATMWEIQANFTQKLSHLALTATQDQKKIMAEVFEFSDSLKKVSAKSISQIEEERKKLIVIQEVFRKKTSEKAFHKSFKDKSFKLALEELLDEKSGVAPKRKKTRKILEEADEDGEGDCTKFFSMIEFQDEILQVKKSFKAPPEVSPSENTNNQEILKENKSIVKNGDFKKQVDMTKNLDQLHPFKKQLLNKNEVFKLFPVTDPNAVRSQLPILRDPNVKIDVWAILKDNIGKELSKITMPVYLNEPLTFLQKHAEMMEYTEFFRKANNCPDPIMRLIYVLAVFYMPETNMPGRMKKPFNPLLGETFEYVMGDLKYIAELVCHHPPILAFHIESDDFVMEGDFYLKSKLSISGFEFFLLGKTTIKLKKTNEIFEVMQSPRTSVHNYIIGKMYLWLSGETVIVNKTTGDEITLNHKPKGWTSKNDFEVEGFVKDKDGDIKYHLFGKWDSFLSAIDSKTKKETKIATRNEIPKNIELQYLFTKFAINLNQLSTETFAKAAPTDSRFRPDQRAYENGNLELAGTEKNRLEEIQRKRRKENEMNNVEWKPVWFEFTINGDVFSSKYKGGYFECRNSGKWPDTLLDLFND